MRGEDPQIPIQVKRRKSWTSSVPYSLLEWTALYCSVGPFCVMAVYHQHSIISLYSQKDPEGNPIPTETVLCVARWDRTPYLYLNRKDFEELVSSPTPFLVESMYWGRIEKLMGSNLCCTVTWMLRMTWLLQQRSQHLSLHGLSREFMGTSFIEPPYGKYQVRVSEIQSEAMRRCKRQNWRSQESCGTCEVVSLYRSFFIIFPSKPALS